MQLIPSGRLGRPRIDVVVQTSGQFRDLAASRLALISRAVEMAASAEGDTFDNQVAKEGNKINKYTPSNDQSSGKTKGKRVGIAYELENGEIIYVPETE